MKGAYHCVQRFSESDLTGGRKIDSQSLIAHGDHDRSRAPRQRDPSRSPVPGHAYKQPPLYGAPALSEAVSRPVQNEPV